MPYRFLCGLLLIMSVLQLGGCITDTIDDTYGNRLVEAQVEFDPGKSVVVDGENGDITIRRVAGTTAKVRADIRAKGEDRIAAVQVIMQTNLYGDLILRVDWPIGWRQPGEAATIDLELPGCLGLTVHTGNGAIEVSGLGGTAILNSGNGEIAVHDHAGDLEASTSNGTVRAERISGECRVRTSNGQVELNEVAGRVSVATTNGPVEAALTQENPGPVDIRTANGRVELTIGSGFTGDLRLETFNGSIRIDGVRGEQELDDEREWAVVHRGGEDARRSLIRTTNGRILLRQHPE